MCRSLYFVNNYNGNLQCWYFRHHCTIKNRSVCIFRQFSIFKFQIVARIRRPRVVNKLLSSCNPVLSQHQADKVYFVRPMLRMKHIYGDIWLEIHGKRLAEKRNVRMAFPAGEESKRWVTISRTESTTKLDVEGHRVKNRQDDGSSAQVCFYSYRLVSLIKQP
jgi:hypothetical protein